MFETRTSEEVHQEEVASVTQQSDLSDVQETGIVNAILKANADQIEAIELRQARLERAFGLDVEGQDLDDVVNQWPGFEPRGKASPAQGAVLELTRDSSVGALAIDNVVVGSASGKRFIVLPGQSFLDGLLTYPGPGQTHGYVVSVAAGPGGNVDAKAIRQVIQAPEGIIGCRSILPLTNGQSFEDDRQLRKRALDWLAGGVSRSTPRGVLAVVKAFVGSDGTRIRHASVWADPSRPYAEIIVDDGRGFVGMTGMGQQTGGIVPLNGQPDFWVDYPVADAEVTLYVNDAMVTPSWVLIHERGMAFLRPDAAIWAPGDTWRCGGHQVYLGVLRELQAVLEGLLAWHGRDHGFRATATRLRLRTATPEYVSYYVARTVRQGFDPAQVDAAIVATIDQFHLDLEQGKTMEVFHLSARLESIAGVGNLALLDPDDTELVMRDQHPSSQRHKLATSPALITVAGL